MSARVPMKPLCALGLLGTFLFLAGCATESHSTWTRTGDPLIDGRTAVNKAPAKDKVLWEYRTALETLRRGGYDEAKSLLDDALLSLGGMGGNDKDAKKARSYFSEESKKNFRGEPYERVMAYYYRGILYWMDGEPDNARACFRNAQFQDSDTENKEYSSDYIWLDYLDGFASTKVGGDGSDAFKRAVALSKMLPLPPYNKKANALFFVEFGEGPTKYATGEYAEELRIRPGVSKARGARLKIGNQIIPLQPCDDLNFQAMTRGGRIMDHILANKAVFKSTTDIAGNAALIGGAVTSLNRGTQDIGLGLLAFGLVSKIVSATTTPAADIRCWNNLPQFLSFTALELPVGQHTAVIEFLDGGGQPLPVLTKTVTINVTADHDTVIFVSDKSHTSNQTS